MAAPIIALRKKKKLYNYCTSGPRVIALSAQPSWLASPAVEWDTGHHGCWLVLCRPGETIFPFGALAPGYLLVLAGSGITGGGGRRGREMQLGRCGRTGSGQRTWTRMGSGVRVPPARGLWLARRRWIDARSDGHATSGCRPCRRGA